MPKIGNPDAAPVAGLEVSDINDGDIITGTRKLTTDGGKTIVFAFTLPSGQEITSEPVLEEHVKKAIYPWLDYVKSAIVEEANSANAVAVEAQLKAVRDQQWATEGIPIEQGVPTDAALSAAGVAMPRGKPRQEDYTEQPLPSDAKGFVRAKLKEAKATVAMLKLSISQRQAALRKAERAVQEWQRAAVAFQSTPKPKGKKR